ncbi:MAG: bifunctional riboflavin kinase/FAD synthetase [Deltaproteobacteria bacterium]|nr:bifunctional riboflavin kinase/FAD synthetase [Deltaproteobacteria bacterium]
MKLVTDIEKIRKPYPNAVITIGNFDGVHLGHQALFREVIRKAREIYGTAIAMTFEPHPVRILKGKDHPPLITMYEQKIELIERAGLDILICVSFTPEFAAISAKDFVENLLVKRIGMKAIVVGKDYSYGKNREGNLERLKADGNRLGFEVIVADWIKVENSLKARTSSTLIRELVEDGRVTDARKLLGRPYQIRGKVVKGRNRGGRLLDFPTANINLEDELCPKSGVYAVTVELEGKTYNGVANIGYSPTFADHQFTVEVHILDLNGDIYGKKIRVNFIKRIRDERTFRDIDALSEQIRKDVKEAVEILSP